MVTGRKINSGSSANDRRSVVGPWQSAMGRIPAGQSQSSANGSFLIQRMSTSCPKETFVVSVAQRQVFEWSGRSERGLTENYSAFPVIGVDGKFSQQSAGKPPIIGKFARSSALYLGERELFTQNGQSAKPWLCESGCSEAALGILTLADLPGHKSPVHDYLALRPPANGRAG